MFIYDELIKFKSILVFFKTNFVERCSLQYSIIPDTIYKGGPSLIQNVGAFKIVTSISTCTRLIKQLRLI